MKMELEGFDELEKKFQQMGQEVGRSVDQATKSGAWFVRGRQEARAPEKNVTEVVKETSDNHSAVYWIGLTVKKWFLRFIEFGSQPHEITGEPLAFLGDSGLVVTDKVNHPGMAAHPFIKPSLNRKNSEQVMGRMGKIFWAVIGRFLT